MDDGAALRATIAADPAADLPRLVYADWLEDGGDDGQAAMIRAQVQLAHEPAWSPLAVRCRHHTPDVLSGKPWRNTLPAVSPRIAEWHPETPFRRGLPDWLVVRDLASFLDDAARLFALAPITTLSLPTSSLGYWQDFARQPWLRQVRALHFYGVSTPIEPLRVLANAVNAGGVEELTLERTSGPAFPVVLGDLFQSDLGKRLKRLDLRAGGENGGEWVEALERLPAGHPLESLELRTMELGEGGMNRLTGSPVFQTLRRLHMHNEFILHDGLQTLFGYQPPKRFEDLALVRFHQMWSGTIFESVNYTMRQVRRLDLSHNNRYELATWFESPSLNGLKSLSLVNCRLFRNTIDRLVSSACWPSLTEIDLRGTRFSEPFLNALLKAEPPTDLVAITLSNSRIKRKFVTKVQDHFRGAVVFADDL